MSALGDLSELGEFDAQAFATTSLEDLLQEEDTKMTDVDENPQVTTVDSTASSVVGYETQEQEAQGISRSLQTRGIETKGVRTDSVEATGL